MSPSSPWGILHIADDWISLIIGQPSKYYFGCEIIALTSFDSQIVDPMTSALSAEPSSGSTKSTKTTRLRRQPARKKNPHTRTIGPDPAFQTASHLLYKVDGTIERAVRQRR